MVKIFIDGAVRDLTAEEQAEYDARQTAWNNESVERQLTLIREIRFKKLEETDWWVLRGNMSEAQTQYRQKLRDIPADYDNSKYDELLARNAEGNLTHSVWSKP